MYTIGYTGWTPQEIKEAAERYNAVVCDIRFSPASRHPQWSGKQLTAVLGARYRHLRALGNGNYKNGGPIAIVDMAAGAEYLQRLHDDGREIILLCVCATVDTCHRQVVSDELQRLFAWPVFHLAKPANGRTIGQASGQVLTPVRQLPLFG